VALRAVLQARPDHPETLLELARIHEGRGELSRALELLRRAEARAPDRPEVLTLSAKVLNALGRPREAGEYTRRYTEQQRRDARRADQRPGGFDARDLLTTPRNPLER
jgi:Tfp pilus assembly protein PilF